MLKKLCQKKSFDFAILVFIIPTYALFYDATNLTKIKWRRAKTSSAGSATLGDRRWARLTTKLRDWSSAYLWPLTGLWANIGLTNLKNWKINLEKLENKSWKVGKNLNNWTTFGEETWYHDTVNLKKIRFVVFIWVKQPIQNY